MKILIPIAFIAAFTFYAKDTFEKQLRLNAVTQEETEKLLALAKQLGVDTDTLLADAGKTLFIRNWILIFGILVALYLVFGFIYKELL